MKAKILSVIAACCLLVLAVRFVQEPTQAQTYEVPEKYRETVNKGLEYLVQHQFKDGHWEGDGGNHPVAMTGLVGLAVLMERNMPTSRRMLIEAHESKFTANVRKAADWLMERAQANRDGLIFSEHASETSRYMQGHGLATIFLAGACDDEKDDKRRKKLTEVLNRAVKYIVSARSTQGGWYDTSKVEGHDFDSIPATVIQIQALQAAENAGIPVPGGAVHDAKEYLKKALAKYEVGEKAKDRSRPVDTAAALACLVESNRFLPNGKISSSVIADELRVNAFKHCETAIPLANDVKFGRDELVHYYYAQARFNRGGDAWNGYRTAMFDRVQGSQNKDGSWPASGGICVGPVYATAIWCTVLQLDRRTHPSTPQVHDLTIITNDLAPVPTFRFAWKPVTPSEAFRS